MINPKSGYVVNSNHTPFLVYGRRRQSEAGELSRQLRRRHQPHQSRPARAGTVRRRHVDHARGVHRLQDGPPLFAGLERHEDGRRPETGRREGRQGSQGRARHRHEVGWLGRHEEPRRRARPSSPARPRWAARCTTPTIARKPLAALKTTAEQLKTATGRIDPEWGEVSRVARGEQSWPTNGGPDTLRAVYAAGDLTKEKFRKGRAGDTYIVIADWAPDGTYTLDTIHQYGSATIDAVLASLRRPGPAVRRRTVQAPAYDAGRRAARKRRATTGRARTRRSNCGYFFADLLLELFEPRAQRLAALPRPPSARLSGADLRGAVMPAAASLRPRSSRAASDIRAAFPASPRGRTRSRAAPGEDDTWLAICSCCERMKATDCSNSPVIISLAFDWCRRIMSIIRSADSIEPGRLVFLLHDDLQQHLPRHVLAGLGVLDADIAPRDGPSRRPRAVAHSSTSSCCRASGSDSGAARWFQVRSLSWARCSDSTAPASRAPHCRRLLAGRT